MKIKEFVDDRGRIQVLADNWLRIETKAGSIRASHRHLKFGHLCFVESGQIIYYERKTGATHKPKMKVIDEGESFYTAKLWDHTMTFPVDGIFYCLSDGKRDQKSYERDTVKLNYDLTKV